MRAQLGPPDLSLNRVLLLLPVHAPGGGSRGSRRDDHAHKLSYRLATENTLVAFEELHVRNMVSEGSRPRVADNGRVLGRAAPTDCVEGGKARRESGARPTTAHRR
jgi:hypothetical protein